MRGAQGRRLEALSAPAGHDTHQLRARDVVRAALRVYRDRFRRVAGVALVVFGITAFLDAFVEITIDDHQLVGSGWDVALEVLAAAVGTFGLVFFAGVLDLVLHDHREGRPDRGMRQVLADLPLGRLLAADVVVTLATLIGLVLLVVPGIVVFTVLCLVGPVIVAEDRRVLDGLRRSARLVRTRFWLVFLVVTVPVGLEEDIVHVVDYRSFSQPLLAALLVTGVIGAAVSSLVGLVEVVLAHELTRQNPEPTSE